MDENIFHDISNNINFVFCMLIVFYKKKLVEFLEII
jgi:hypothetical protein